MSGTLHITDDGKYARCTYQDRVTWYMLLPFACDLERATVIDWNQVPTNNRWVGVRPKPEHSITVPLPPNYFTQSIAGLHI